MKFKLDENFGRRTLVGQCLQALEQNHVVGKLWIVEPNRIRIHQTDSEE